MPSEKVLGSLGRVYRMGISQGPPGFVEGKEDGTVEAAQAVTPLAGRLKTSLQPSNLENLEPSDEQKVSHPGSSFFAHSLAAWRPRVWLH